MSQRKGDGGAYAFTRAAYDEVRDSEIMYAVHFDLRLETGYQKGIWCVRIRAMDLLDNAGGRKMASWEGTWPNSMAQTFEAFLYGAVHRVARMVEEVRNREGYKEATRQK